MHRPLVRLLGIGQAPGVNRCSGGPGADSVNLLAALDQWVTKGKAPEQIVASKVNTDGSVAFTRPLCQYPQLPSLHGPANDANAAKLAETIYVTHHPERIA
ncbi:tannase/feruloyl esterase family alpha/beta hydrolase [Cupriavidus basilensis]